MDCEVIRNQYLLGECSGEVVPRTDHDKGILMLNFCDNHYQQLLDCKRLIEAGYDVEYLRPLSLEQRAELLASLT